MFDEFSAFELEDAKIIRLKSIRRRHRILRRKKLTGVAIAQSKCSECGYSGKSVEFYCIPSFNPKCPKCGSYWIDD